MHSIIIHLGGKYMVGEHKIIIERRKLKYEITIKHKLNIFNDASGTGKSLLETMVYKHFLGANDIKIKSDLKVRSARNEEDLVNAIEKGYNLIIFDERPFKQVCGKNGRNIARYIKDKPVYCIFITRDIGMTSLPVDIEAVYRLESCIESGREVVRNVRRYNWNKDESVIPDVVFTEDKKLGYEFYSHTLRNSNVISLGGTGNITKLENFMRKQMQKGGTCFLIADGCAFGFLMPYFIREKEVYKTINGDLRLFLPPSFEYLILDCGIVPNVNKIILKNAYYYAKIEKYMSLESFYEDYLSSVTGKRLRKNSVALKNFIFKPQCVAKLYEYIGEIKR